MVTRHHENLSELGEVGLVLQAAQSAISQEFSISERLDAKIRSELGAAAAWFAVVTGITGAILTRSRPIPHGYTYVVVSFGFLALALLVATSIAAYDVWRLQDEKELAPSALFEMTAAARDDRPDEFADKLVRHYASILASRRQNNQTRASAFRIATFWFAGTIAATLAELVALLSAAAFS